MRLLTGAGSALAATVLAPVLLIGVLVGGVSVAAADRGTGVDPAKIPPLAAALLPRITALTTTTCPALPSLWVIAHIQAESGWDPATFRADPHGGTAGLYQLDQTHWTDAGGHPWTTTPPGPDTDIAQPDRHLQIAIPWVCANLRRVTAHLTATGKQTDPLDAMLVCHIAGCDRVTGSASGIPTAGEAGCDTDCAHRIGAYLDRVHKYVTAFSAAAGPVPIDDLPPPAPSTGTGTGCTEPDPTTRGCLTPATLHALNEVVKAFGPPRPGSPIRAVTCWDRHAWNPTSDHPKGRACDLFPTRAGEFPQGQDLVNGWRLATWLRTHAHALHITYLIWQGRFWSPDTPDDNGWGTPYTGGGIYNPHDATGGHYDHIHLSIAQ